jgi:hypothetical protein
MMSSQVCAGKGSAPRAQVLFEHRPPSVPMAPDYGARAEIVAGSLFLGGLQGL